MSPPQGSTTFRVSALTQLRALAAAGVFLVHVEPAFAPTPWAGVQRAAGAAGGTGVVLFFVLSGYLLAQPSALRGGTGGYAVRRIARIYPVYLVALGAMILLYLGQGLREGQLSELLGPGTILLNLLLAQSWSADGWYASIVYPAWSLSVEVLFYALLPYLYPRLGRFARRRPRTGLGLLAAGGALGAAGLALGWWPVTFPPAYLAVFLFGSYLAIVRPKPLDVPVAALLAAAALTGWTAYATVTRGSAVELPAFAVLAVPYGVLVHSLASVPPLTGAHRGRRPLETLGEASYAFFLVHAMTISVVSDVVLPGSTSTHRALLVTVVAFTLAWIAALVLFRAVERPAQEVILRRLHRPQVPVPSTNSPSPAT